MPTPTLTAEHREILEHALGFQDGAPPRNPHRNHFAADGLADTDAAIKALCDFGLMRKGRKVLSDNPDYHYYHVTAEGVRVIFALYAESFIAAVQAVPAPKPKPSPKPQAIRRKGGT